MKALPHTSSGKIDRQRLARLAARDPNTANPTSQTTSQSTSSEERR